MRHHSLAHVGLAILACATTALSIAAHAQQSITQLAPPSSAVVAKQTKGKLSFTLSHNQKLALVRQRIKYVFVLFQENRSFDFYFGTYPGADGLYSKDAEHTPGFTQPIVNVDGSVGTIHPFRIPATVRDSNGKDVPLFPMDVASVNHSHVPGVAKLHLDAHDVAANDRYAVTEEGVTLIDGKPNHAPTLARKQMAELVMAHVDCDTVPYLWQYADRFTLFDHFMDTVIGPSGPNALAMISGQSGATEWMLHPELAEGDNPTVPMLANPHPRWDESLAPIGADPKHPRSAAPAQNMTYATLPLSFMGTDVKQTTGTDRDPKRDLLDVQDDMDKIGAHGVGAVPWGWYQQGYGHEPGDPVGTASHNGYVAHHNAPQYFGYIANNPQVAAHLHGMQDFFDDVEARRLPAAGGVFYVRGGYGNIRGYKPQDPNPRLAEVYNGDDDHPGYADSQISEAFLAEEIDAIAASPYWSQSAIFIAYDESDGEYDHVPPTIRSRDPRGKAMNQGPRIPFLLLSPYAVAHGISHEPAEHSSIIKFVDELFGLIPLADLPDEEHAREIGRTKYHQNDLGPADDKVANVGDLLSGFDDARLSGKRKPLDASYIRIDPADYTTFPHRGGQGCQSLGIRPTDFGRPNPIPADFNPRPETTPGIPTAGEWTP